MIDILMSTYNGADFLEAQLDSILSQEDADFRILVRDDGSSDGTLGIIGRYSMTDRRVEVITDEHGNLGSSRSFMRLLEISDAKYFMFADQDDVWLPGKISLSLTRLREIESPHPALPALLFTDLIVCDDQLKEIETSLWKYQRLDPEICRRWQKLLAQNVVTGCTIVGNAAARLASIPFVLDEMFHDHWVAVNAAKDGVIDYLREPSVLYRQHSDNAEGAKTFDHRYARKRSGSFGKRYSFYRKAGKFFGLSANQILIYKVVISLRRFFL